MLYPKSLEDAINSFKKLPGVGEKSAERYALSLLDLDEKEIDEFSKSVKEVKDNIKTCKVCGHLTDKDTCAICSDKNRNDNLILHLESIKEVAYSETIFPIEILLEIL